MANDHYMPWFFGDFMASTATWTGPERGLYAILLGTQWASGPLPADLDRLARALNYEPPEFRRLWPVMAGKFRRAEGAMMNPRLEAIRAKNLEGHERRVAGGKHGAALRWGSQSNSLPNGIPNSPPNGLAIGVPNSLGIASDPILSESESEPNQITKSAEIPGAIAAPEPTPPEPGDLPDAVRERKPGRPRKPPTFDFDRADYPTVNWVAFESFVEHRKIIGKAIQPKGAKDVVALMSRFTPEQQAQMVSSARVGGWSGLYEPKGYTNGSTRPAVRIRTVAELEAEERGQSQVTGEGGDVQRTPI